MTLTMTDIYVVCRLFSESFIIYQTYLLSLKSTTRLSLYIQFTCSVVFALEHKR